jgi:16S rRNA (guanine966-N2)-methyltransferase
VLDLFAGTGALGLEALSRGAATATFVERDRGALESLRANLSELTLSSRSRVMVGDVILNLERLAASGERFECVLLDPPYAGDQGVRVVETLAPGLIICDNGLLVVQAFHKSDYPERIGVLSRFWQRRYGESRLTVYRKESA